MKAGNSEPFLGVGGDRVWEGLLCATAWAAVFTGLSVSVLFFTTLGPGSLVVGVFAFFIALIPWGLGVLMLGPPVWAIAYKLGWTGPWAMAALAAIPPFAVVGGSIALAEFGNKTGSLANLTEGFASAGFLGAIGAVAGFVAQRVAYRP